MDYILKKTPQVNILEFVSAFVITMIAMCHGINLISKVAAFTLGLWLLALVMISNLRSKDIVIFKVDLWIFLWIIIIIFHRDPAYPYLDIAFYVLGLIAFFLLRSNHRNFKAVLVAIICFSVVNIIVSILSAVSPGLFGNIINILKVSNRNVNVSQFMTGLANGRSRNATLLVLGMSVCCSALLAGVRKNRTWYLLLGAISFVLIMTTGKLSHSLYSLIVFLALSLYMNDGVSKKLQKILLMIIIANLFFVIVIRFIPHANFIFTKIINKAESGDLSSGRLAVWSVAFDVFKSSPIIGEGYGSFQVNSLAWTRVATYAGVHNDYLQWLCETGVVGFVINIIIMFKALIIALRELKLIKNKGNMLLEKTMLIWSVFFQMFVILYSFTGIPHFSYDVSVPYLLACAIPYSMARSIFCDNLIESPVLIIQM